MEDLLVLDFKVKSIIHDYNVKFINNSPKIISQDIRNSDVFIIDRNIVEFYPQILKSIDSDNIVITIDANEDNKSYQKLTPVINKLIKIGFRKNHRLIGIGGGITQDITSFISSIMYRGVSWIFFPTTLLAQGDSCIGSKTSINFGKYKNQLGGFYPPNNIYIDINFLNTLTRAEIQSGFGEMCHYFLVSSKKDFDDYKLNYNKALSDQSLLPKIISRSLLIKKKYIEIDEFDQNERQIFNYGHSFGHAIESLTNYKIPHGIAVSFGMDMANFISVKMGFLKESIRKDIREFLKQIWCGYNIENLDIDKFCNALSKDKKNIGDELRLILFKDYGKAFKTPVKNNSQFHDWLVEYFNKELLQ
tara:strand:+ start:52585 stop:53667 length:1083 start_codon:yes stop_codon:yes gene_type:complete